MHRFDLRQGNRQVPQHIAVKAHRPIHHLPQLPRKLIAIAEGDRIRTGLISLRPRPLPAKRQRSPYHCYSDAEPGSVKSKESTSVEHAAIMTSSAYATNSVRFS